MQQAEKFDFNTVFGESENAHASSTRTKTRFSASEVEEIRKQAYADGKASVEGQAAEACAQALSDSANALAALFERLATSEHNFKIQAFDLALLSARKIARRALELHPEQEIESLVQQCLTRLPCEPHIIITVADRLKKAVEPHLMELAQNQSFSGKIRVTGSDAITGASCKIEWSEGGVEKNPEDIGEAIEALVRSRLAAETPLSEQGDLFQIAESETTPEELPSA